MSRILAGVCQLCSHATDDCTCTVEQANAFDYAERIAEAEARGTKAGKSAASWVFDGNTTDATYRAVLRMIEDGDPALDNAVPEYDPLSGEWAGESIEELLGDLFCDCDGGSAEDETVCCCDATKDEDYDSICDAYETAARDAYYAAIEEAARAAVAAIEEAEHAALEAEHAALVDAVNAKLQLLDDGSLPAYAWPGGYPLYYLTRENDVLCPKCANKEPRENIAAQGANYEDDSLYCDECSERIEEAYPND